MTILLGRLNDSPAAIVAQLLIDMGIVVDPGNAGTSNDWPVSVDSELDSPDNEVNLTNTEPQTFGRVQVTGQTSKLWGFQVKLRSSDAEAAYAKINQIEVALDQQVYHATTTIAPTAYTTGGTYFVGVITVTSGPLSLGREGSASKRSLYTLNAIVDVIQVS